MSHEENYWRTLIILRDPIHSKKLTEISNKIKLSRAKLIGTVIDTFIKKYEISNGKNKEA